MAPRCRFRRIPTPHLFFAFTILATINTAAGLTTNLTIDDQLGDPATGLKPQYSGPGWNPGQSCNICSVRLDPSQTYERTWYDSTYKSGSPPSITLHFIGTAVYVYNVLVNQGAPNADVTGTNITFTLDGHLAGTFAHTPTSSHSFNYNYLVFASHLLENTEHVLVIQPPENQRSLILFDYAMYTFTEDTPPPGSAHTSSQTPTSTSSPSSGSPSTQTSGNVSGFCVLFRKTTH